MTQEHLEVVRRGYEAWNRDDFDAARQTIHPDVEWRTSGTFPGLEPVYYGHEGVRRFWRALKEPWDYFTIHIERSLEEADTVVVEVRFEAVGRESGVKVELPFAHVWRVEDGLVVSFRSCTSLGEALEVAGLEE